MHPTPLPHHDIWSAIFTAAFAFPELPASATNQYGSRYTSLQDILTVAKPILTEHRLLLTYATSLTDHIFTVYQHIHLIGTSEQTTSEIQFILSNGSAHEIASLLTGARRYLIAATFSLALGSGDDGNKTDSVSANGRQTKPYHAPLPTIQPPPDHVGTQAPGSSAPLGAVAGGQLATLGDGADTVTDGRSNVHKGVLMQNLWRRLILTHGKSAAEAFLRLGIGSPSIRAVTPDQFDLVICAIEQKLKLPTPRDSVA